VGQAEVNSVGVGTTSPSEESVGVDPLLAAAGASALGVQGITGSMGVDLLVQLSDIDDGHFQLGQVAALDTLDHDVGAVMVELVDVVGSPRHGKQTLVRVSARGNVLGDHDRPLVVDIRASLGVLANDVPGLACIVRQRELTGSSTVASLGHTLWWGELLVVGDIKVPEANGDDFTGLVAGDGALLVATAREFLSLVTDPGVDGV